MNKAISLFPRYESVAALAPVGGVQSRPAQRHRLAPHHGHTARTIGTRDASPAVHML